MLKQCHNPTRKTLFFLLSQKSVTCFRVFNNYQACAYNHVYTQYIHTYYIITPTFSGYLKNKHQTILPETQATIIVRFSKSFKHFCCKGRNNLFCRVFTSVTEKLCGCFQKVFLTSKCLKKK